MFEASGFYCQSQAMATCSPEGRPGLPTPEQHTSPFEMELGREPSKADPRIPEKRLHTLVFAAVRSMGQFGVLPSCPSSSVVKTRALGV